MSASRAVAADVVVVGGGTAGLSALAAARRAGASVRLVERGPFGTTCARTGCMPSKLLLAPAHARSAARRADALAGGVVVGNVDGRRVLERLRRERDAFVAHVLAEVDEARGRGEVLDGEASFAGSPTTIRVTPTERGEPRILVEARAVVVATGARAAVPEFLRGLGHRVLTHEGLFELDDLPRRVLVVGGGPIGLELGQALARLGVEVVLLESDPRLGVAVDARVRAALERALARDVRLVLGATLREATPEGDGVRCAWGAGEHERVVVDRVLVATGRPPELASLGAASVGLAFDDDGRPVVDRSSLRWGEAPVFVAGEARGTGAVLHESRAEGLAAGDAAARLARPSLAGEATGAGARPPGPAALAASARPMLRVVFVEPGLASVGVRADALPEDARVAYADYADQGRAKVEARNEGVIALFARPDGAGDAVLLGAEACAPDAEHLVHWLALAVHAGVTVRGLLAAPVYHPVLEEGVRGALLRLLRGDPDPCPPPGC